jgi:DNA-binding NarL/FixJ family response regulator
VNPVLQPVVPEPATSLVSVWLVEDNALFRETAAELIDRTGEMRCTRAFPSCEDALAALAEGHAPQVVLLDIGLPGMSGLEGIGRIKAISPSTHVIMQTVYEDNDKILRAICAGASGYLLKTAPAEKIVEAIREVLAGGAPMNAQIARRVLTMFAGMAAPPPADYALTERERQILQLLVDFTVDTHLKNIYAKLQVHSRSGAIAKALNERLV